MAKGEARPDRVDPQWPAGTSGHGPVSELASDRQGSLSPFGEENFPVPPEALVYTHPVTVVNR